MTAFSDEEEEQSKAFLGGGHMKLFPQDSLGAAGADFAEGKPWSANVVEDRELISGQEPRSARGVAAAMPKRQH